MAQDEEVVITDADGNDHVFPPGFDPERAAMIVKSHRGQRVVIDKALDMLPAAGGLVGGIVGGVAGGPLGAIAGAGFGGSGGEGVRQTVNQFRKHVVGTENLGPDDAPTNMDTAGTNVLTGGLSQAAQEAAFGQVVPWGLRTTGYGLYRGAAAPINSVLEKYGDPVQAALDNWIPVSLKGRDKAIQLTATRQAEKKAALAAADQTAEDTSKYHWLPGLTRETEQGLAPHASHAQVSGYGDPTKAWQARSNRILDNNYWPALPSEVETIKHTVDDQIGPAWEKIRRKQALLPNERYDVGLSETLGDAQGKVIPGYDRMNEGIMDAVALDKMLKRRTSGSGGNQGLENLAAGVALGAGVPPGHVLGTRVLQLPPVASHVGIGVHELGAHPKTMSAAMRAAIFALMAPSHQTQE